MSPFLGSDPVTSSFPPFCACAQPYAKAALALSCASVPRSVLSQGKTIFYLFNPSCPALGLALKQTPLFIGE